MIKKFIYAVILVGLQTTASAHFVFVVPQPGGATAQVILSEDLKPNEEVDVAMIGGTKLTLRDGQGRILPLTLTKADHMYVTALPGGGTRLISGMIDLGWMQRGDGKPNLLLYYPKSIVGDAFDPATMVGEKAPVEIVAVGKTGAFRLKVVARGKALPNSEITVIFPDGTQKVLKTDSSGQTEELKGTGRYAAWARFWETSPGERDGKKYEEVRNYATLVMDAPAPASASASPGPAAKRFATLPEATSSFGAVALNGWLYVYGGHIAPTHSYSSDAVSGRFSRIRLDGPGDWQKLPDGPPAQGMNLAAYGGKIYRIGGMTPRNKPGTPSETYSIADCARFDPDTKKWEELPPLPEPRSSHDVVVIGSKLIVVGGWALKGPAASQWADNLQILDLSKEKLEWKSVKEPFRRRALIATAHSGKMYVLGGFGEDAKIVREVAIYDPATDIWTKGPALPGTEVDAFAPASCIHQGSLYVSLGDGSLYRLDEAKQTWEKSGTSTPRLAHRLASAGNSILVIGGASKGSNSDLVESLIPAHQ